MAWQCYLSPGPWHFSVDEFVAIGTQRLRCSEKLRSVIACNPEALTYIIYDKCAQAKGSKTWPQSSAWKRLKYFFILLDSLFLWRGDAANHCSKLAWTPCPVHHEQERLNVQLNSEVCQMTGALASICKILHVIWIEKTLRSFNLINDGFKRVHLNTCEACFPQNMHMGHTGAVVDLNAKIRTLCMGIVLELVLGNAPGSSPHGIELVKSKSLLSSNIATVMREWQYRIVSLVPTWKLEGALTIPRVRAVQASNRIVSKELQRWISYELSRQRSGGSDSGALSDVLKADFVSKNPDASAVVEVEDVHVEQKQQQQQENLCQLNSREAYEAVAFTLIAMGHENISSHISWVLYLLAAHPEEQEKAYREVKAAMDESVGLEWSVPAKLPYLGCIIKEVGKQFIAAALASKLEAYHMLNVTRLQACTCLAARPAA
eukprot:1148344-Pelagomonas_calceolata.AAC.2